MTPIFYAVGSAIWTRSIIEKLKELGWIKEPFLFLPASLVINTALAMAWAFFDGQTFSTAFFYGVVQTVAAALYHDVKKTIPPQA